MMQAENGGPAPQRTGFIQEGMQNLAASIGGAIAGHVSGIAQNFARNGMNRLVEAAGFVPEAGAAAVGVEAAGAAVALEAAEAAAVFPGAAIPAALAAGAASLTAAAVDAAGDYVRSVSGALFQNQNNTNLPPHVAPAHLMVNGRIPGQPEVHRIHTGSSARSRTSHGGDSLPEYQTPPASVERFQIHSGNSDRSRSSRGGSSVAAWVPPQIPQVGPIPAPVAPAPHSGSDLEANDIDQGYKRIARPGWASSVAKRQKKDIAKRSSAVKRPGADLPKLPEKKRNTKQPKILAIKDVSKKRPGDDFPVSEAKRRNTKTVPSTPEAPQPRRGNTKAKVPPLDVIVKVPKPPHSARAGSSADPVRKLPIEGPIATNWRSASSVK